MRQGQRDTFGRVTEKRPSNPQDMKQHRLLSETYHDNDSLIPAIFRKES